MKYVHDFQHSPSLTNIDNNVRNKFVRVCLYFSFSVICCVLMFCIASCCNVAPVKTAFSFLSFFSLSFSLLLSLADKHCNSERKKNFGRERERKKNFVWRVCLVHIFYSNIYFATNIQCTIFPAQSFSDRTHSLSLSLSFFLQHINI